MMSIYASCIPNMSLRIFFSPQQNTVVTEDWFPPGVSQIAETEDAEVVVASEYL